MRAKDQVELCPTRTTSPSAHTPSMTTEYITDLSNTLIKLGDVNARLESELYLNLLIINSPESVLISLATIGRSSTDPLIRFTAFTLLRTLPFKPLPGAAEDPLSRQVYELINDVSKEMVQEKLLDCLINCADKKPAERSAIADCIAAFAAAGMDKGRKLLSCSL